MDCNFVSMLALCWLAGCSHAGYCTWGAFYYVARLVEERKGVRLSRISGLRSACQRWIDRAESGRLRGHRRITTASIPDLRIHLDSSLWILQPRVSRPGGRRSGLCLLGDAAAGTVAWAVIIGRRARWGRWQPSQLNWSSGRELYWSPPQALLRSLEVAHGALIVIGFDNASNAVAVGAELAD